MSDQENKKDQRRQNLADKSLKREGISEEERYVSKSKKQLKKKKEDLKADELWDDWEQWKDHYK